MKANDFINKWRKKEDSDRTPLVGIEVFWDKIMPDSETKQLFGIKAWKRIYDFTPPWFEKEKRIPFRNFIEGNGQEYQNEIKMEKEKTGFNKFEFIKNNRIIAPLSLEFVAFADSSGLRGVLGDGCHRFLVVDYLIRNEGFNLTNELKRTELDIIYLRNFSEVIPFDPFCHRF